MNLLELGALGDLIGGVAVILTLLYLAVQVRQNTISLQTSAYQQWVALHGQTFAGLQDKELSDIVLQGCIDSRNLSEDTYIRFMTWVRQYMYMQQGQYYLYVKGVIDKDIWDSNLADLVGVYKFPGVRQWWDAGAKEHFNEQFVAAVENADSYATMFLWNKEQGFYPTPFHSETEVG